MTEYRKNLTSPTGDPYVAKSPREANDLIFGSGYREADEATDESFPGSEDRSGGDIERAAEKDPNAGFAHGGDVSP